MTTEARLDLVALDAPDINKPTSLRARQRHCYRAYVVHVDATRQQISPVRVLARPSPSATAVPSAMDSQQPSSTTQTSEPTSTQTADHYRHRAAQPVYSSDWPGVLDFLG